MREDIELISQEVDVPFEERGTANVLESEDVKDRAQNRIERKKYARSVFVLICVYLGATLALVGTSRLTHLSDAVLITLLSTTTATVVGLFVVVVKFLFNIR